MVAIACDLQRAKRPSLIPLMRPILTLFLTLLAAVLLRAEAPPLDGTMPEDYLPALRPLLKEAVERSPTTLIASVNEANAEAANYGDAAALWPQLSGSAEYEIEKSATGDSPSYTSKGLLYQFSGSQQLFAWGALRNQALLGRLGKQIAARNFAEAYRLLAVTLREQYMALVQKKIQLRNAQFTLKIARESQAAEQARFDAGSSSEAELQTFKMTSEQNQLDSDRAQEDYSYSKQVFARLVGLDALDDTSIPLELPHPKYSAPTADAVLAGFVGGGIESTFQSEVYNLEIHQSDLIYKIAKVRLLPKFSANAVASYQNTIQVGTKPVGTEIQTYDVQGAWQIFDGFATKGAKLSALATKRLYERQRQTYVDAAIDQIANLRHALGFSARAMSIAEVHDALIGAEVKRINQDLALGYASQAQIDSGTLTLYSWDYQQAYARTDFLSRWTEFVSMAGIDPALAYLSEHHAR